MQVALITPTRDRGTALQLCFQWMRSQQLKEGVSLHWIVSGNPGNDHEFNLMKTEWPKFLTGSLMPGVETKDPLVSFRTNLTRGLNFVSAYEEVVIFIEDDDYYAPGYVQACIDRLDDSSQAPRLIGEAPSRYFHVGLGAQRNMGNTDHASLSCTAFNHSILDQVKKVVSACDAISIDCDIWRSVLARKKLYSPTYVVGMKGLPGAPNLGVGGDARCYGATRGVSSDWATLAEWIGDAPTAVYRQLSEAMKKKEAQDARTTSA